MNSKQTQNRNSLTNDAAIATSQPFHQQPQPQLQRNSELRQAVHDAINFHKKSKSNQRSHASGVSGTQIIAATSPGVASDVDVNQGRKQSRNQWNSSHSNSNGSKKPSVAEIKSSSPIVLNSQYNYDLNLNNIDRSVNANNKHDYWNAAETSLNNKTIPRSKQHHQQYHHQHAQSQSQYSSSLSAYTSSSSTSATSSSSSSSSLDPTLVNQLSSSSSLSSLSSSPSTQSSISSSFSSFISYISAFTVPATITSLFLGHQLQPGYDSIDDFDSNHIRNYNNNNNNNANDIEMEVEIYNGDASKSSSKSSLMESHKALSSSSWSFTQHSIFPLISSLFMVRLCMMDVMSAFRVAYILRLCCFACVSGFVFIIIFALKLKYDA
jgi:hypothetical protein